MASYSGNEQIGMSAEEDSMLRERPRSCSAVSSPPSLTTPARPMSVGSSATPSRTLVQPRPWRFLQRSRQSSSLERERALQEDTSLEGDEGQCFPDEAGSSVDGELVVRRSRDENSEDKVSEGNSAGTPVDAVVRTKSESDIAIRRNIGIGDTPEMVVFKSKAQRFSRKDDKATPVPSFSSKTSHLSRSQTLPSRSQTLPLSLPPQLLAAVESFSSLSPDLNTSEETSRPQSLPPSVLIKPAETLTVQAEPVTKHELETTTTKPVSEYGTDKSDESRRRSLPDTIFTNKLAISTDTRTQKATVCDQSPNRRDSPMTVNGQDSFGHMTFSKPAVSPLVLDQPLNSGQVVVIDPQTLTSPKSPDKPKVPVKPARKGSLKTRASSSDSGASTPTSPTSTTGSTPGPPKPPRTTLDPSRRGSANLGSPKSPMEDVLFSMGFTVVDDAHTPLKPKSQYYEPPYYPSESKSVVSVAPQKSEETLKIYTADFDQSPDKSSKTKPVAQGTNSDSLESSNLQSSQKAVDETDYSKPIEHNFDFATKKMTKIKGDKKAEEKAAKAKKKEQKAKEKELKAKRKAASKDEAHPEKGRLKLLPWKVDFSSKDKNYVEEAPSFSTFKEHPSKIEAGWDVHGPPSLESASDPQGIPAEAPSPVHDQQSFTATTKKAEKEDGSRRSPRERPDSASPPTPSSPPENEDTQESESLPSPQESPDNSKSSSPEESKQVPQASATQEREIVQPSSPQRSGETVLQVAVPEQQQQTVSPPSSPSKIVTTNISQNPQPSPSSKSKSSQLQSQQLSETSQQLSETSQQDSETIQHLQASQKYPETSQQHNETSQKYPESSQQQYETSQKYPDTSQLHPETSPPQQRHERPTASPARPRNLQTPRSDDVSSVSSSDMDGSGSGSLRRKHQGKSPPLRFSESDGEATSPDGDVQGKRLSSRRHTVEGAQIQEHIPQGNNTNKKREAFYELLANRYPQYADKITGMNVYQPTTAAERNARPREPQRRRTTVVTYNPQSSRLLDNDDACSLSDVEPSGFQRGGVARASLPIVRSASSSLERPIGLVFLVFRDETKKALLPNEITTLDTVRALFVRAFPDKLSLEFLDSPKRKIYILETATSIFFQLEDLRDIHDRTVLKIHECDSEEPQRVRSAPESRGRAAHHVPSRPSSRQGHPAEYGPHYREEMSKTQSLPVSAGQSYPDLMHKERAQWEMEQEYIQAQHRHSRSRSQTPELAERPRSLSTGAPRNRYSHSPERLPTPERAPQPLNPIPENPRMLANGFRQAAINGSHYEVLPGSHSHQQHPPGHSHPPLPGRVLSPPPPAGQPIYESVYQPGGYSHPQAYLTHSMRAAPQQGPQRATGPSGPQPDMRGMGRGVPPSRHSQSFAAMANPIYDSFPQRSQSYRSTPERDVLPPRPQSAQPHDANRMERMEAQIATLAAWVHQAHVPPSESGRRGPGSSRSTSSGHSESTDTYPGSSASSLSDIPSAYSVRQPVVTQDMRDQMNDVHCRLQELRVELQGLKRMEQLNQKTMRETFSDTFYKIKSALGASSGNEMASVGYIKMEPGSISEAYMQDKVKAENELSYVCDRDLETRVDSLKEDIIARRCRISISDIEGHTLQLSHITKSLSDLKDRVPHVHNDLKNRSARETPVINEEKFSQEETTHIEAALKRCKAIANTLVTLKRLATSQETKSSGRSSAPLESADDIETMGILDNIRAMMPDYESRVHSQEAIRGSHSREGSRHSSTSSDNADGEACEPPQVPAKPARLLTASELKQMGVTVGTVVTVGSGPASASPTPHTVTVTSQISHNDNSTTADRGAARSAFFSSMQSSQSDGKTSSKLPSSTKSASVSSGSGLLLPSVSSSSSSPTSPSHSRSGVYYQAASPTRTRSAFSSIPLPNRPDKDDSSKPTDKGKKIPPPPPPRRSSSKLSYGVSSPANGGVVNSGRRDSGEKSPDARKKDVSLSVYKPTSPTSPGMAGLKSGTGPKPMNKFQKDIAAGIYANMNRPDLQHQKMAPDRLITDMSSPAPAAVVTNSQDPPDEGDLSGSESTGSTTSLDSQQGASLLRANPSASSRGPKPNPPQRHSSLSCKGPGPDDSGKTKTQMLQERVKKSQESGNHSKNGGSSAFSRVNGLDNTRNGFKT